MDLDPLDEGAQPRCPDCAVLVRNSPDGYICPSCGHEESIPEVEHPGYGDGLIEFGAAGKQPPW